MTSRECIWQVGSDAMESSVGSDLLPFSTDLGGMEPPRHKGPSEEEYDNSLDWLWSHSLQDKGSYAIGAVNYIP